MNILKDTVNFYSGLFAAYPVALAIACGLLGLFIGSFLNVVALRVPSKQSIVYPPSHCAHCRHRLSAADLIPVLSYMLLGGKCRYCEDRVSPIYPAGELFTALMFALVAYHTGFTPELVAGLFFVSILAAITISDLVFMLIPDKIVFTAVAAGLILRFFIHPLLWWEHVLGMVIAGAVLYAIAWLFLVLLHKEGMGGGDIKLFLFIGLMLGWKLALLTLFAASVFGLAGVLCLARFTRWNVDQQVPFGPFIALGAIFSYIWGDTCIQVYTSWLTGM